MIVDAKFGFMWKVTLKLNVDELLTDITDLKKLVAFLQQRSGAKAVLMDVLTDRITDFSTKLSITGDVFDILVEQYRRHLDNQIQLNMGTPAGMFHNPVSFRSAPVSQDQS